MPATPTPFSRCIPALPRFSTAPRKASWTALAPIFAAAWRFLGVRASETAHPALDAFCVLPGRIRAIDDESELRAIEDEVDGILRAQLARAAGQEEGAPEAQALIAVAQRLDNLIHHRRTLLTARAAANGTTA